MAYRVFMSHNSEDFDAVQRIVHALQQIGVEAYAYENDPQPGDLVTDKIKEAIRLSDAMLVFLTKRGSESAWVQQESGCAEMANIPVIPLVESGLDNRKLALLTGREYVGFDPAAPDEAFPVLKDFLGKLALSKHQREWLQGITIVALGLLLLYFLTKER